MSKPITLPWNAAAWRQNTYQPRVTKVHDPIGEKRYSWGERLEDSWTPNAHPTERYMLPNAAVEAVNSLGTPQREVSACHGCGYHVCSCKPNITWCLSAMGSRELMGSISGLNSVARGEVISECGSLSELQTVFDSIAKHLFEPVRNLGIVPQFETQGETLERQRFNIRDVPNGMTPAAYQRRLAALKAEEVRLEAEKAAQEKLREDMQLYNATWGPNGCSREHAIDCVLKHGANT